MNTNDAARLARQTMNDHGLTDWTFQFDRAKKRFGVCKSRSKVISLSEPLVRLNDQPAVLDVILHEVAHALAGPGAGHGPAWKAIARQIGANPERCYDAAEVNTPAAPWVAVCEHCGPVHGFHRRPKPAKRHHIGCGGSVAIQANHQGWTKRAEAVAADEPKREVGPTLDDAARERIAARAAARRAEIRKDLGR